MVLPSMPKGEIVGNMALQVGIDVNTMTRLAFHDCDVNIDVGRLLAVSGWHLCQYSDMIGIYLMAEIMMCSL